jgi:hypothetical protein
MMNFPSRNSYERKAREANGTEVSGSRSAICNKRVPSAPVLPGTTNS